MKKFEKNLLSVFTEACRAARLTPPCNFIYNWCIPILVLTISLLTSGAVPYASLCTLGAQTMVFVHTFLREYLFGVPRRMVTGQQARIDNLEQLSTSQACQLSELQMEMSAQRAVLDRLTAQRANAAGWAPKPMTQIAVVSTCLMN